MLKIDILFYMLGIVCYFAVMMGLKSGVRRTIEQENVARKKKLYADKVREIEANKAKAASSAKRPPQDVALERRATA